jgi:hypothetical protein
VSTEDNDAAVPAPEAEPVPELAPEAEPVPEPVPAPPPPKPSRLVRAARAVVRAFLWIPGALERAYLWMRARYGGMDARTAGLYRIVLGFLCAADCIRHWWVAPTFYSNDGVLKNHYHLFAPSSGYNFSAYHAFSSVGEVHVAFALSLLCHLCLMVGWRARLFSILSCILVTSLDNRLVMVENGGYVVVNLTAMYAVFLPIGRRFSVDAWLRSWRERRERTADDLNERRRPAWQNDDLGFLRIVGDAVYAVRVAFASVLRRSRTGALRDARDARRGRLAEIAARDRAGRSPDDDVSLACFLVVLNLAVVYFFNVVNKSGWTWRCGETVHYVLFINRMVTGLAVFFRNVLPLWSTRLLSWGVICLEASLVAWILWPSGRRVTRTLALLGIWALHTTFGVMMRLGPFSWFMIGWSFTIVDREQWAALERFHLRRAAPRTVLYDGGSPLAFTLARVLARLDGLELLHFEEGPVPTGSPAGGPAAGPLLAARDEASGQSFEGSAALREIVQALPGGCYAFPVLRLVLVPLFALFSARREGVARFFGLAGGAPSAPRPRSPLRLALGRGLGLAREAFLVYFAAAAVLQAVIENKSIPAWAKPPMPKVMEAMIGYPRIYQGWGMFSPNPIRDDGTIVVDARTVDGRSIDPFTGKEPALDLTISDGLGLGQIQQDYFNRIRLDGNTRYRQGLSEYLRAWHHHTGRPEDELVSFDVYWVRDQCPKLDEKKPYQNELYAILTWRRPGYKPPPGLPPLPPEPKVQSAEPKDKDVPFDPHRPCGIPLPGFVKVPSFLH